MNIKHLILIASSTLFLASCSLYQIDSSETSLDYHPPKTSTSDVQYIENVTKPYDVIGYVTVNAERRKDVEMLDILAKMRHEAAVMGADAITNIKTNGGTGKWAQIKPKELFGNSNLRTNFVGEAIIFKQSSVVEQSLGESGLKSSEPNLK